MEGWIFSHAIEPLRVAEVVAFVAGEFGFVSQGCDGYKTAAADRFVIAILVESVNERSVPTHEAPPPTA
jgi:hypothetical protein